jgi:patatin-like phospholipase/acyl hydrolase
MKKNRDKKIRHVEPGELRSKQEPEHFQILSLDGGGIRGLFSAAILAHLEEDLDIKIIDYFDLIVGTSTGGIIALALGMGMELHEVVHFYINKGPEIFAGRWPSTLRRGWHWSRHWFRNKFKANPLENALKECFGEKLLADSKKRLVISSYNLGDDDIYLFKTPHHDRLTRDYKVPMWKVATATSVAPTYFPSFQGVDRNRLIDGGVWANNPIMIGVAEAVSLLNMPLSAIHVLSLGTTNEVKTRPEKLDRGGIWQWKENAVDVVMKGQSRGALTQAQHLIGKDKVFRIDPNVPDKLFALDKLSESALLGKAAHESRQHSPKFKEMFMGHIAPKYKPFHL